jgi:hypothetical protein
MGLGSGIPDPGSGSETLIPLDTGTTVLVPTVYTYLKTRKAK